MLQAKLRYWYAERYMAMVRKTLISFEDAAREKAPPKKIIRPVAKKRRRK